MYDKAKDERYRGGGRIESESVLLGRQQASVCLLPCLDWQRSGMSHSPHCMGKIIECVCVCVCVCRLNE